MTNIDTRKQFRDSLPRESNIPPHITACGEAFSRIYGNVVVELVQQGLSSPLYVISRALAYNNQTEKIVPASYSRVSISPFNGTPGNGKLRATILQHAAGAKKLGFSPHRIISSSGEVDIRTGGRAHYGETMNAALLRNGTLHRKDGSEVPLGVQGLSTDTIGEVFAMPGLITGLLAENGGTYPAQENRFTVYSSTDQVDRMRALEALMFFQNTDTLAGQEAAQLKLQMFRETFRTGPVREYLQRHREEIIDMAQRGEITDTTQVLKALYLLEDDNLDAITYPNSVKSASDTLYLHPRYQETFARCAPNLRENLQTIIDSHIDIFHLTAEEIIIALDKTASQGRRYASLWLKHVYGTSPRENIVLSTFINELAGIVDFLRGEYYAQGDKAETKLQFAHQLSELYEIPLPVTN
jgi:hypothetical protein